MFNATLKHVPQTKWASMRTVFMGHLPSVYFGILLFWSLTGLEKIEPQCPEMSCLIYNDFEYETMWQVYFISAL